MFRPCIPGDFALVHTENTAPPSFEVTALGKTSRQSFPQFKLLPVTKMDHISKDKYYAEEVINLSMQRLAPVQ